MHRGFIGRERELAELQERWHSGGPELFIVYGRRRVGKTELLLQFSRMDNKKTLYFLASLATRQEHLRQLTEVMRETFPDPVLRSLTFTDWETVLTYLGERARTERLLVILDEFPYLCEAAPELPSAIQRFWDLHGKETKIFFVLCGSQLGFMEREVLGERSPLYGRRTGQLRLRPFHFREASLFFPGYGPRERLIAYGILGGMPAYLIRFSPELSLRENLLREMLQVQGYLYEEPRFLLRMELRDPKVYASILGAIASGCTKLNEISQRAGLPVQTASKYLGVLQELELVEREVPFTARAPQRSKRGRYRLRDNYLNFWFRFVQPHASMIEAGQGKVVYERFIAPYLDEYMGHVFEEVARSYMRLYASEELELPPVLRVGREWGDDFEIDLIAEHADGSWTFGECKWTRGPVGERVIYELQNKVERLSRFAKVPSNVRYAIFSSSGFDPKLRRVAEGKDGNVLLLSIAELLGTEKNRLKNLKVGQCRQAGMGTDIV